MRKWMLVAALIAATPLMAVADEVELTSGEVLKKATVVERTDEKLVIEHAILGRLEIEAGKVKEVRPDPPPEALTPDVPIPAPTKVPKIEKPKEPEPEWKWKISLGAKGETGNGESHNIRTAIEGFFESREHRWKLSQTWDYERDDGDRTTNKFRTYVLKDWLVPNEPWFYFVGGIYEWDEFQEWDGRISVPLGVGYEFVKTDESRFAGRVGFAGIKETGVSRDKDAYRAELLLGLEGEWKLTEAQSIKADTILFPDLTDGGEYRVVSNFAWNLKFADTEKVSLQLGFHNEYDTHTERPFDKNEFEYFIALVYEF